MVYRHILVPIDGSQPSFNALEAGIKMAIEQGSILTALYVVPKVGQLVQVFAIKDVKDAFYQEGENIMDKAREMANSMNFKLSVRIKEGTPHKIIIETAQALDCDLIVMGNQGRSGPSKLLIGSCTQRVLAGAPCPVLVVRE
ncbi:MAG: universal stress protein [Desulfobacterales bacterium]|nr:universal stress protein [Desulfobacterales bacterium]